GARLTDSKVRAGCESVARRADRAGAGVRIAAREHGAQRARPYRKRRRRPGQGAYRPVRRGVSARKTGNSVRVPLETASLPPEAAVDVQHWVLDSFAELQQLRAALFAALNGEPMPPGGELDAVPEH